MSTVEELKKEIAAYRQKAKEAQKKLGEAEAELAKESTKDLLYKVWKLKSNSSYFIPLTINQEGMKTTLFVMEVNYDDEDTNDYLEIACEYWSLNSFRRCIQEEQPLGEELIFSILNRYFERMFNKKLVIKE